MNDNDLRPCLICGVQVHYGRREPVLGWLYKRNQEPEYGWLNADGTRHLHVLKEKNDKATNQQG